jgi:hypothetical protein
MEQPPPNPSDFPPPPPPPPIRPATPPPPISAATPPTAAYVPPKKSKLPWILGGCGCLTILVIIAIIVGWAIYKSAKAAKDMQDTFVSAGSSGTKTFVATTDNIPASLRTHFTPFSFKYPDRFIMMPPSESNYVKVEESEGGKAGNTMENFAVGPAWFPEDSDNNEVYPQLLSQLSPQLAKGFPNYKELAQVPETVGGNRGRAMLFTAQYKDATEGNTDIFGKVIVVRQPKAKNGVVIIVMATSLDPDVKSAGDVGVKGDGAAILNSFKLL